MPHFVPAASWLSLSTRAGSFRTVHVILTGHSDTEVVRDSNTGFSPMLAEALAVAKVAGETMLKLVPISIAFGIIFGVLTHWSACNPGRPWWRKREIVTDICYWFLIPLAARFVRIGFMVMGAAYIYGIHGADALINFYDDGFGPLAKLPLWAQALTFLVVSDFLTYWIHRGFHGGGLWKYHAVHHSSEELDWISAARFHPVNIFSAPSSSTRACCWPGFHPMSCYGSAPSRRLRPHSCTPI